MSDLFSEEEMKVRYILPGVRGRIDLPVYNAPVSPKEVMLEAIREKNPKYMPNYRYYQNFCPKIFPDIEARGFNLDGQPVARHPEGFNDMFGIKWNFVEVVGGAMVEPGHPLLDDMNEWEKKISWPDPSKWDWEGQRKISESFIHENDLLLCPTIMNGYFERLISMMDFENAAVALIDDEQKNAVHAFLDRLADLYIRIIDLYRKYFPEVAGFTIHDDWGSQRAPFFSLETVEEMLVPHMRKVADHLHKCGLIYDMHCCGKVEKLLPAMIEIGVDSWSGQPMNDKVALYHAYGDKILIGIETPVISENMGNDEVDAIAKKYVDEFFVPGKPGMIGFSSEIKNQRFFESVYRYSRKKYLGIE